MPEYRTPTGQPCSAAEAMIDGRLRPGFGSHIADGETVHFSLSMRDAAPGSNPPPKSIDEFVRAQLGEASKVSGIKASETLANASARPGGIEKLINPIIAEYLRMHVSGAVASALQLDAATMIASDVARDAESHRERFAFLGDLAPPFDAGRSAFLAANRQAQAAAGTGYLRDLAKDAAILPQPRSTEPQGSTPFSHSGITADNSAVRDFARSMQYR